MRLLSTKQNVNPPSGTYPFGQIRDNPGDNTGTPYNESLYGDLQQFIEKLFNASGIVANALPENATNGFQLYQALQNVIYQYKNIIGTFGTTQLDSTAFGSLIITLGGGIQTLPISIPGDNNNGRSITLYNFDNASTIVNVAGGNNILGCTNNTIELNPGDVVTITQWSTGIYFVSQKRTFGSGTKVIPIGNWNMQANGTLQVPHGLTMSKIVSVSAMIIIDTQDQQFPLVAMMNLTPGGSVYVDATNVNLFAMSDGEANTLYSGALSAFRNGAFSSTSINRGWITIEYAD